MNLEELAYRLTVERESDRLQELEDSFYDDSAQYIRQLEQDKDAAKSYKEASMIDDEIKNARLIIEGVFDRRMSKIIEYAAIAASGTRVSVDGMTGGERSMYESLISSLEKGRKEILEPILEMPSRHNIAKNISYKTTSMEQPIENALTFNNDLSEEVMLVRVLKDIPRFVGVDGRHYQLSGEDVVVLPKANALVLCNKSVAIPLQNQ